MNPAIILALEYGLRFGPDIGKAIAGLFKKGDVTPDEIIALMEQIKAMDFDSERNKAQREFDASRGIPPA